MLLLLSYLLLLDEIHCESLPNFLILFVDDLGYGDLGFTGHPTISTPNIDRLAYDGMILTQWYSGGAVCSPSRAAMLTGRLTVRSGCHGGWTGGVFAADAIGGLPLNETTFAEILKQKGYNTKMIGKWHLGQREEYLPTNRGFDEYFGIPYSVDEGSTVWDLQLKWPPLPLLCNTTIIQQPADLSTLSDRYSEEAVSFIKYNSNNQNANPWLLYMSFSHVHVPEYVSKEFCANYSGNANYSSSLRGRFGDVMNEMDKTVQQIMNAVNQYGFANNTLTFFTSDNGPWKIYRTAAGSSGLFSFGKTTTWEGGIRMPGFVNWPTMIAPFQRSMELVTTYDIFMTMVALSNSSQFLANDSRIYDGKDMTQIILNNGKSLHECLYFYLGTPNAANCPFYNTNNGLCQGLASIRCGSFKIHYFARNNNESYSVYEPPLLFNVDIDPSEQHPIWPNNNGYNETVQYMDGMRRKHQSQIDYQNIENQMLRGRDRKYALCCDDSLNCSCNNWKQQFLCQPLCADMDTCGREHI